MYQLKLNVSEMKRVPETISVGVIVDKNLQWEEQFKTVKNKIRGDLLKTGFM